MRGIVSKLLEIKKLEIIVRIQIVNIKNNS
jgi:hypothetical protein